MRLLPRHHVRSAVSFVALAALVSVSSVSAANAEEVTAGATPATASPAVELDALDVGELSPSAKDEFSNTYDLGDGNHVTEVSAEPLHIKNASGAWVDVATAVSPSQSGGGVVKNNPLSPKFAQNANDNEVLSLSNEKYFLSFSLDGAASSTFSRSIKPTAASPKSDVVYPDVFDGVDLAYDINPGSVKETLVLDAAPGAHDSSWTWDIDAAGLDLVKDEVGDLRFIDAHGTVRFTVPAPTMWDSSGVEGVQEPAEQMVDTTIIKKNDGHWGLTLSASSGWLGSSERVYPVYVDPTAIYGDTDYKSYRSDGYTSSQSFRVGNSRDNGANTYWRNLVKFDYDALFGKQIIGGKIKVTATSGDTVLRRGSVNTAACRGYDCVGTRVGYLDIDTAGETTSQDLPAAFADWVNTEVPGHAIVFRGAETAGVYTYKTITPTLQLIWKDFPVISGLSSDAIEDDSLSSSTPVLNVTIEGGATAGTQVRYLVNSVATNESALDTGWMPLAPVTVPKGFLAAGEDYTWKAQVRDADSGTFGVDGTQTSATWRFAVEGDPAATVTDSTDVNPDCVAKITQVVNAAGDTPTTAELAQCRTTVTMSLGESEVATEDEIENDPGLSAADKVEILAASKTTKTKKREWSQSMTEPGYAEVHGGRVWYNGKKAWQNGTHKCSIAGSWSFGLTVENTDCFVGKDGTSSYAVQTYKVYLFVRGFPVSWTQSGGEMFAKNGIQRPRVPWYY